MTNQDIDDILCAAFEGGINYWCDKVTVVGNDYKGAKFASDAVSRGAVVELRVSEDGAPPPGLLTRDSIVSGIIKAAKHKGLSRESFIENHDAGDADMAIQFAIFDKLIFG